jgi:hypothetical protein
MPWLPVYMDPSDADDVVAWFNADPEIAFIVGAGAPEQVPGERLPSHRRR